MMTYKYQALSTSGVKVNGVIDAADEYTAVSRIKAQYPVVLKISEVKTGGVWSFLNADLHRKLDPKALSVMCSQFSIILGSGVSIDNCIRMIASQTKDKQLKKMLESSAEDVAQGTPLASAFEKNYPGLPVVFIETLRAGEMSGTLEESFKTMQHYYEKSYQTSQKVKQALSYPLFVVAVAIVVLLIVMIRVVPTLTSVFDSLGGELPTMTVILINMADFFGKWWLVIVGVILALYIGLTLWHHTEKGKLKHAENMLKMPVIGNINMLSGAQEFANTMAALIQAGLPVSRALDVTSKCMSNYALQLDVKAMVEKVETGHPLSEVIAKSKYFPQVLKEMTGVGEKTGELVPTLQTIGDYYANESDYATKKAISKIEPTLLIVMAFMAGFIVIAIYLPMFTMYNYM